MYHSRWWGAASSQDDVWGRFNLGGGVRKGAVFGMLLLGNFELPQSDAVWKGQQTGDPVH